MRLYGQDFPDAPIHRAMWAMLRQRQPFTTRQFQQALVDEFRAHHPGWLLTPRMGMRMASRYLQDAKKGDVVHYQLRHWHHGLRADDWLAKGDAAAARRSSALLALSNSVLAVAHKNRPSPPSV